MTDKPEESFNEPIYLVYDDQCPVCRTWCRDAFSDSSTGITLVDARRPGDLMDEITAAGLDVDQGMVLKVNGKLFYDAEAIREATALSPRRGIAGSMNHVLFSRNGAAALAYPLGKAFRSLLLRLLGIPLI
ncbi:MAG: DUF393 domain-containing protein [Rhodospirillaceae bacterium]|jgi:predicted DCC family thiol-disulfide oxidoreductase YuxK|nr:DUF393 domain-containing protein [Rhodospirillaceae bacterium]MBT6205496.1 DUF393 domain-containing protein [Rhodospirillaceae bacterium]MBT6511571.1 DUF393 domain-containing protein [Rhodospirillaceae bacterium]MBT7612972.1 DUF393 domain-containing protein [Rhodospirillaceae bacterium]MBT7649126.1 DUF393 domain-containing protein [Rhodospirillaceae bacterium]